MQSHKIKKQLHTHVENFRTAAIISAKQPPNGSAENPSASVVLMKFQVIT